MGACRRQWSPEENARFVALFESGLSRTQLRERFGLTRGQVAGKCARLGLKRQARTAQETLDLFAHELSERGDIALAAMAIGISNQHGKNLFSKLRCELGWQAV